VGEQLRLLPFAFGCVEGASLRTAAFLDAVARVAALERARFSVLQMGPNCPVSQGFRTWHG